MAHPTEWWHTRRGYDVPRTSYGITEIVQRQRQTEPEYESPDHPEDHRLRWRNSLYGLGAAGPVEDGGSIKRPPNTAHFHQNVGVARFKSCQAGLQLVELGQARHVAVRPWHPAIR